MDLPDTLINSVVIERGVILHSIMFEHINHGKLFVIIGVTETSVVGFFFINSNICQYVKRNPDMFAMQYPMKHSKYEFLHYDSYLDANELQTLSFEKIAYSIKSGQTTVVGHMTDEDLQELLSACRESRLFNAYQKRQFFY